MDYIIDDTLMTDIADAIRYSTPGLEHQIEANEMPELIDDINSQTIYGFHIDSTESDPDACITYLEGAVGKSPAYMDFTNDEWNWGGWQDAFFMPKPCMLKYDGSVDYYLDPDDYTKKEDGTASDVANINYNGNAMMEWPKIYMKIVPDQNDDTSASIYFSDKRVDNDYKFYPYIDPNGNEIEHFYTAIYNGSNVSNKLRSLSERSVSYNTNAQTEISYANANNVNSKTEWNIELFSDILLITFLNVLITKSLDCKNKIGHGIDNANDSIILTYKTGSLNKKGLFYGTSSTYKTVGTKVFGMENIYSFQWKRILGLINNNGIAYVKLCYGTSDGSSTPSYNTNGSNYINSNISLPNTHGWLNFVKYVGKYAIPYSISGSSNYYYCCFLYSTTSGQLMAVYGCDLEHNSSSSIFCYALNLDSSASAKTISASLSCKPLAN